MAKDGKWKFVLVNGGWWLCIEDFESLVAYVNRANIGGSFLDSYWAKEGLLGELPTDPEKRVEVMNRAMALENAAAAIGRDDITVFDAARALQLQISTTYLNHLHEDGFVYINKQGGCNSMDWPRAAVMWKEDLVWPEVKREDIRFKTYAPADYREGYNYHTYVYLGNIQLHDGDTVKWDSRAEAEAFVDRILR